MSTIGSMSLFQPSMRGMNGPPNFRTLDSDSSGALSMDEFKAGAPKGADEAGLAKIFSQIDSDGDGSITAAEDESFRESMMQARSAETSLLFALQQAGSEEGQSNSIEELFASLDGDGDGSITQDEFRDAFGSRDGSGSGERSSSDAAADLLMRALSAYARQNG